MVISGVSPHDAYLKMWALSEPKLSRKYSHIILDEAQDTNPVTAGVVANQRDISKLLIGDRHQSIYLFRKSTRWRSCTWGQRFSPCRKPGVLALSSRMPPNAHFWHFSRERKSDYWSRACWSIREKEVKSPSFTDKCGAVHRSGCTFGTRCSLGGGR